jgi:hypothetical protein
MIAQSSTAAWAREASLASEDADPRLQAFSAFPETSGEAAGGEVGQILADWVRGYLMRPHPDLGRPGAVCPFTPAAARLDAIRVGSSPARDEDAIHRVMRRALAAFDSIDCPRGQRHFRAVIVAFPNCAGDEGRARLKAVQNRLRPESILRGKMIGLFEPHSPDKGLINPDFRPLRSPVPLLAIRMLVENDAPFVLRNPRLAPIYLIKFPLTGPARLWSALWR